MTEDQQMFVKLAKDFGEKRLAPTITERDHHGIFDEAIVKEMLEMGLGGTYFPEEYGGAGADVLSYIMFTDMKEEYKVELIQDLPEDAQISLYRQGEYVDLCAGPHVD